MGFQSILGYKHPVKGTFRRLIPYLKPYKLEFIIGLCCMVVFGATDGGVPFLVKYILDGVFANQDKNLLTLLPFIILAFALVRGVADYGQEFFMSRLGHRIVKDLRSDLNRHLLTLPPGYFVQNSSANILTKVTNDTLYVKSLLTESLASIIRDTIRIITLLSAAIYLDPLLAGIAIIAFPLGVVPIMRIGKRMRKLGRRGQESVGALNSLLQSTLIGGKVVRIFGREPFEVERFNKENQNLFQTLVKGERARALTGPLNEILAAIAVSGVLLYGGTTVIAGVRTQGEFISFLLSVFLLYDPFKRLSRVHASMQQSLGAADRLFEVLDTKSPILDPENPAPFPNSHSISIDRVTYTYPGASTPALKEISLEIPEGKRVALVGFSGAGKSTAVDLIPRFMDPSKGSISIGGVDLRSLSLNELRSKIAMVSQHTFLFHDTVYENIRYGKLDASEEEIFQAAKDAYAHDFIINIPEGYNALVGEGGHALSGGERQRVAIARALLKNAPILILDEATASLDNRSEREVQEALSTLMKNRTTIVIAHRLSTVIDADMIVVFQEGKIVETGTHQELFARGGSYAHLYNLQFKDDENRSVSLG